jgi:hypothetical protein
MEYADRAMNESYSFRYKGKLKSHIFACYTKERQHQVTCGVSFYYKFSECYEKCHGLDSYSKLMFLMEFLFGVVELNASNLIFHAFYPII